MLYFNTASSGLISESTISAIADHLQTEAELGAHAAAKMARAKVDQAKTGIEDILHLESTGHIAFIDSATRAWNQALHALPLRSGDRIVSLVSEFGSNLVSLFAFAEKIGATIELIPCGRDGEVSWSEFTNAMRRGVRLVALSHVAAHGAIENPVVEIGQLCREFGALYLVDGTQAVGHVDVRIGELNCDIYIGTGRKWLAGPRGVAFSYFRMPADLAPVAVDMSNASLRNRPEGGYYTELSDSARRFELWERSIATIVGLCAALTTARSAEMGRYGRMLREAIEATPGLRSIGSTSADLNTACIYSSSEEHLDLLEIRLKQAGVVYSVLQQAHAPLHIPPQTSRIIRLSPSPTIPEEHVETVISCITESKYPLRRPLTQSSWMNDVTRN